MACGTLLLMSSSLLFLQFVRSGTTKGFYRLSNFTILQSLLPLNGTISSVWTFLVSETHQPVSPKILNQKCYLFLHVLNNTCRKDLNLPLFKSIAKFWWAINLYHLKFMLVPQVKYKAIMVICTATFKIQRNTKKKFPKAEVSSKRAFPWEIISWYTRLERQLETNKFS